MTALHIQLLNRGLEKTRRMYGMLLDDLSKTQAATLRDGPDGWNILEILCHVRDYQDIYMERIESMLGEEQPTFKAYNRFELMQHNNYGDQDLDAVFEVYSETRSRALDLFRSLSDAQWARQGYFQDGEESNVLNTAVVMLGHDNDHLEQIMRVLESEG